MPPLWRSAGPDGLALGLRSLNSRQILRLEVDPHRPWVWLFLSLGRVTPWFP